MARMCSPMARGRRVLVAQALGQVFMKTTLFPTRFSAGGPGSARPPARRHGAGQPDRHSLRGHIPRRPPWAIGATGAPVWWWGTHTHIPTADAQISARAARRISRMLACVATTIQGHWHERKTNPCAASSPGMARTRFEPAMGEATLCGLYVETDGRDRTRHARPRWCGRAGGWPPLAPRLRGGRTAAPSPRRGG